MRARPLLLAAWFALAGAAVELLVLGVEKYGLGQWIHADVRILWLAPASYLMWLLPLGLTLAVGQRALPRGVGNAAAVFLPALAGAFGVLWLFYPRFHRLAILVLAVGIAAHAARLLVPRLAGFQARAVRQVVTAVSMLGAFALATGVQPVIGDWRDAARGRGVASDRPNIVLVVLDTVRSLSLSVYGHVRPTSPGLEALAARGVLFRSAHATTSWTLPSHASLFTGRHPHELSAGWITPLDGAAPTLAERLRAEGYRTAGFVANLLYCGRETGLARGFAHYEDAVVSVAEVAISSALGRFIVQNPSLRELLGYYDVPGRRDARDITAAFLDWQAGVEGPFFAFLNLYDAHAPYLPPEPFASRFGTGVERQNRLIRHTSKRAGARTNKVGMTAPEIEAELRAYEAGIAYMDAELDAMFRELERRGVLDNTIVIVTSDHGELFGEHGRFAHGQHLYRPLLEVPLIVAGTGRVPAGRIVAEPVSLRDLPATILDLTGTDAESALPGTSLAGVWQGRTAPSPVLASLEPAPNQADRQFTAMSPMRSLITAGYQYIGWAEGRERLFDRVADPDQLHDLAGDPAAAAVLGEMRAATSALGGIPVGGGPGHPVQSGRPPAGGAELARSASNPGVVRSP